MNAVRRRLEREMRLAPSPSPSSSPASVPGARRWLDVRALRPTGAAAKVDVALPDALEGIARALRSGLSLRVAIAEASAASPPRLRSELADVAAVAERGRPLAAALDGWIEASGADGVRLAAAALALSAEVGGAAARSLDGVADTLRDRNALHREIRALSSQARASAMVIGAAPAAFAVLVALVDPASVAFLVTSPAGWVCLGSGAALDGLGAWWMRAIAGRAGRDRDAVAAQQSDVIDLFVLVVGAGLNLRLALAAIARRAPPAWTPALAGVVDQVERGVRVSDALDALPGQIGDAARPLVRVLTSADRYGTALLPALDRLAVDARLDRRRRAEEAARRVPVKLLFPLVLCVLPAFGLLTVAPLLAGALETLRL